MTIDYMLAAFICAAVYICGVWMGFLAGVLRERLYWIGSAKTSQIVEVDRERFRVEEITDRP